jgi:hypothetical protein
MHLKWPRLLSVFYIIQSYKHVYIMVFSSLNKKCTSEGFGLSSFNFKFSLVRVLTCMIRFHHEWNIHASLTGFEEWNISHGKH